MTDLITAAMTVSLLQATGGVAVVVGAQTTYGHYERVPWETGGEGGAGTLTTHPSVVIADGILTAVGPRKGIGTAITVNGTAWVIRDILPGDPDGGTLRLMLAES